MAEAREARRQRILQRGADRLAFITGERKLASTQPPRVASQVAVNGNEAIQERTDADSSAKQGSIQERTDTEKRRQNGNACIQEGISAEQQQQDAFEMGDNNKDLATPSVEQAFRTSASSLFSEIAAAPKDELVRTREPGKMSRMPSSSSIPLFTLKGFSTSIDGSKAPRALLAVAVAITVVIQTLLAACEHPAGASLSLFANVQPMLLVFTTSISLVFGMMLLESSKLRRKNSNGMEDIEPSDRLAQMLNLANKAELTLNILLVLRKAVGAFSLDCSIYVVALVCIMPLVQAWTPFLCV